MVKLVAGEIGLLASFWWVFNPFLWLAGNGWVLWPLFGSWTCNLVLELEIWTWVLDLKTWVGSLGFLDCLKTKRNSLIFVQTMDLLVGNWACCSKLISMVAQIWGPNSWTGGQRVGQYATTLLVSSRYPYQ